MQCRRHAPAGPGSHRAAQVGENAAEKAALWSFDVYRALKGVPCGNPGIQSPMQGPNLFEAVIHQNLGDARR